MSKIIIIIKNVNNNDETKFNFRSKGDQDDIYIR